jgi:hypothetical protein
MGRLVGMAAIPARLIRHAQVAPYVPEKFCFADVGTIRACSWVKWMFPLQQHENSEDDIVMKPFFTSSGT